MNIVEDSSLKSRHISPDDMLHKVRISPRKYYSIMDDYKKRRGTDHFDDRPMVLRPHFVDKYVRHVLEKDVKNPSMYQLKY